MLPVVVDECPVSQGRGGRRLASQTVSPFTEDTTGFRRKAAEGLVRACRTGMIVVGQAFGFMPVALIESFRDPTIGEQMRKDRVAVHRDADLAAMRLHYLAIRRSQRCRCARKTIRHGVVVIADMGVHMAPANVERRDGVRPEDRIHRSRPVKAHTVGGDTRASAVRALRQSTGDRVQRDDIGIVALSGMYSGRH